MRKTLVICGACLALTASLARAAEPPPQSPLEAAKQAPVRHVTEAKVGGVDADPKTSAGYDGRFFIRSPDGDFSFSIGAFVQPRFTWEGLDGERNEANFSIFRARLFMNGHAFTKALRYKFQADFGLGNVVLRDFYADYAFIPGEVALRVGQFKMPFARQEITNAALLEFNDRAITDFDLAAGREIGMMLSNDYETSPKIEYAVGFFNGTAAVPLFVGEADAEGRVTGGFTDVPRRFRPAVALRAGYNYGGIRGYDELDLNGGPLRFGVGASALVDLNVDEENDSEVRGELDFILKAYRFSTSTAYFFSSEQAGPAFVDQKYAQFGFYVQLGYLIGGLFQPMFRYSMVDPEGAHNNKTETTGGFAVFFYGNDFRWTTNASRLTEALPDGASTDDYLVTSQMQFIF